eukprot:1159597-Pelagomonas_calceolata.AAC.10
MLRGREGINAGTECGMAQAPRLSHADREVRRATNHENRSGGRKGPTAMQTEVRDLSAMASRLSCAPTEGRSKEWRKKAGEQRRRAGAGLRAQKCPCSSQSSTASFTLPACATLSSLSDHPPSTHCCTSQNCPYDLLSKPQPSPLCITLISCQPCPLPQHSVPAPTGAPPHKAAPVS